MPNREELEVGDRIIILDNYSGYKSMRGYHGKIIWKGYLSGILSYQIQTDTPCSRRKDKGNTCFVDINDIKPEPTIDSLLKSPTEKKEGE